MTINTRYYGAAVPSGHVYLLKQMSFYHETAGSRDIYVWLKSGGLEYPIFRAAAMPQYNMQMPAGLSFAIPAGAQVGISSPLAVTAASVTIHGADL